VHLVGFILRIYHDARSSECQILVRLFVQTLQPGTYRSIQPHSYALLPVDHMEYPSSPPPLTHLFHCRCSLRYCVDNIFLTRRKNKSITSEWPKCRDDRFSPFFTPTLVTKPTPRKCVLCRTFFLYSMFLCNDSSYREREVIILNEQAINVNCYRLICERFPSLVKW
jgi:hypothetical protein